MSANDDKNRSGGLRRWWDRRGGTQWWATLLIGLPVALITATALKCGIRSHVLAGAGRLPPLLPFWARRVSRRHGRLGDVSSLRSSEVTGGEGGEGVADPKPAQRHAAESDRLAVDGSTVRARQSRDLGVAQTMLALQRACGNRAVAGLLRDPARPEPGEVAVQRYAPMSLNGVMDRAVVGARATPGGVAPGSSGGQAGFASTANVGWITLGTASMTEPPHIERSNFGEAHTEEKLVEWAGKQNIDLKLAHDDPSPARRVKALYTERHPCGSEADTARKQRPPGSCHKFLNEVLHAQVPVFYSVINGPAPHAAMRVRETYRYFVRNPQVQLLYDAAWAKRTTHPIYRGEIFALRDSEIRKIDAMPLPDREPGHDYHGYGATYTAKVKAAASEGVALINAWQPPAPVAVADQGLNASDSPDRGGAGQSGNQLATSSPARS